MLNLDALAQQAQWTKTPPTVPGWYFYRPLHDGWNVTYIRNAGEMAWAKRRAWEWLGPLSPDAVERLCEQVRQLTAEVERLKRNAM